MPSLQHAAIFGLLVGAIAAAPPTDVTMVGASCCCDSNDGPAELSVRVPANATHGEVPCVAPTIEFLHSFNLSIECVPPTIGPNPPPHSVWITANASALVVNSTVDSNACYRPETLMCPGFNLTSFMRVFDDAVQRGLTVPFVALVENIACQLYGERGAVLAAADAGGDVHPWRVLRTK
jgi:hypothetical protein